MFELLLLAARHDNVFTSGTRSTLNSPSIGRLEL
jgi:hypothetical protein